MNSNRITTFQSTVLIILVMVGTVGCASWSKQGLAPRALIDKDHPNRLLVTCVDSTSIELLKPWVVEDSLKGMTDHGTTSIPISDVKYVAVRRTNPLGPILVISLGVAAGLLILIYATW